MTLTYRGQTLELKSADRELLFAVNKGGCSSCWGSANRVVLGLNKDLALTELFETLGVQSETSIETWLMDPTRLDDGTAQEQRVQIHPLLDPLHYEVRLYGEQSSETRAKKTLDLIRKLERLDGVSVAEPLFYYRLSPVETAEPSKPRDDGISVSQRVIHELGWPAALPISSTPPIRVGILDTGIDFGHADLDHFRPEGVNTIDHGGLGDPHGHGTQISGVIAARGHCVGLFGTVELVSLRAMDATTELGTQTSIGEALRYARRQNISVINASLGGICSSQYLTNQIACLAKSDTLLVASAGDDGIDLGNCEYLPATTGFSHVLCVGAHDTNSNFGSRVHLTAPGAGIYTTYPSFGRLDLRTHSLASGVSMATAVASAAAALLRHRLPKLNAQEIRELLIGSAVVHPGEEKRSCSGGRLHVGRALKGSYDQTLVDRCPTTTASCRDDLEQVPAPRPTAQLL